MSNGQYDEKMLSDIFIDALIQTVNPYRKEIVENFIQKHNLKTLTEHDTDFVMGMVVNEIFNRFSFNVIKHNMEFTKREKEFFYRSILEKQIDLRNSVGRLSGI